MISTRALLKTLSFMFLPTLGILIIVFFWFFNVTAFINFITSCTVGAGIMRMCMLLTEIIFGITMYNYYIETASLEDIVDKDYKTFTLMYTDIYKGVESSRKDYIGDIVKGCLDMNDYKGSKNKISIFRTGKEGVYLIKKEKIENE